MLEQDIQLSMPDGSADAVLFSPDQSRQFPGILHIPDIASIREAHRQMARELASEGYVVLLVNQFYRTSAPPVWSFQRKMGEPRTMERMAELTGPLTVEAQNRDLGAYIDHLLAQRMVHKGPVGAVGFCFGGAMALRAAAARPEHVSAVASFHGGNLYKSSDVSSPHLILPAVKARLYFGHAEDDGSMTSAQITAFEAALAAWGGSYKSEMYAARHGWTVPDNPAFNEREANRAFGNMCELFAHTLA